MNNNKFIGICSPKHIPLHIQKKMNYIFKYYVFPKYGRYRFLYDTSHGLLNDNREILLTRIASDNLDIDNDMLVKKESINIYVNNNEYLCSPIEYCALIQSEIEYALSNTEKTLQEYVYDMAMSGIDRNIELMTTDMSLHKPKEIKDMQVYSVYDYLLDRIIHRINPKIEGHNPKMIRDKLLDGNIESSDIKLFFDNDKNSNINIDTFNLSLKRDSVMRTTVENAFAYSMINENKVRDVESGYADIIIKGFNRQLSQKEYDNVNLKKQIGNFEIEENFLVNKAEYDINISDSEYISFKQPHRVIVSDIENEKILDKVEHDTKVEDSDTMLFKGDYKCDIDSLENYLNRIPNDKFNTDYFENNKLDLFSVFTTDDVNIVDNEFSFKVKAPIENFDYKTYEDNKVIFECKAPIENLDITQYMDSNIHAKIISSKELDYCSDDTYKLNSIASTEAINESSNLPIVNRYENGFPMDIQDARVEIRFKGGRDIEYSTENKFNPMLNRVDSDTINIEDNTLVNRIGGDFVNIDDVAQVFKVPSKGTFLEEQTLLGKAPDVVVNIDDTLEVKKHPFKEVELEIEKQLDLYKRLWLIKGLGITDYKIVPNEDYDYPADIGIFVEQPDCTYLFNFYLEYIDRNSKGITIDLYNYKYKKYKSFRIRRIVQGVFADNNISVEIKFINQHTYFTIKINGYDDLYYMIIRQPKDTLGYPVYYTVTKKFLGDNRHPIPIGEDMGCVEIPVHINIMTDFINVLLLMWSKFYYQFTGYTGIQAVKGMVNVVHEWLSLESSSKATNIDDYYRCFRWMRWEAEKVYNIARHDPMLSGNAWIEYLIEEMIDYMEMHHMNSMPIFEPIWLMDEYRNVFDDPSYDIEIIIDKLKGIRKRVIESTSKTRRKS